MTPRTPDLSVVAVVGRSGDEPRDYVERLVRMLSSVERAATPLRRGSVEAVVVDWNTPSDLPPLGNVLSSMAAVDLRVVEVPPIVHQRAARDSGRRFLEGAAKNVGVARARGQRVLLTNADVLIRSDLLEFCAQAPFGDRAFVRADRYDFRERAASPPESNVFLAHVRHGPTPLDVIHLPVDPGSPQCTWPRTTALAGEKEETSEISGPPGGLPHHFLRGAHTNGAGDFVCVSRESFDAAGRWIDDPAIYHHGDALLVAQLLGIGLRQVIYTRPGALLHEDHPRLSDEDRGGGSASWPAFLQLLQDVVDGRDPGWRADDTEIDADDLTEYLI